MKCEHEFEPIEGTGCCYKCRKCGICYCTKASISVEEQIENGEEEK